MTSSPPDPLIGGPVPVLPPADLVPEKSALICIDLQIYDASPEGSLFQGHQERFSDYFDRVQDVVVPAVNALQSAFRRADAPVIHTRIRSHTRDGSDVGRRHRQRGMYVAPDSEDARFLEPVAPTEGEMVIDKTRSGAFYGTGLDAALRLRGIETAVFCGVVLNNCVESSIREAADRDYDCVVVSDGVAALDQAMYDASMRVLSGSYARVMTSRQVVEAMGRAARGRK